MVMRAGLIMKKRMTKDTPVAVRQLEEAHPIRACVRGQFLKGNGDFTGKRTDADQPPDQGRRDPDGRWRLDHLCVFVRK